jgi:vitamin B12 transporter
MRSVVFVAPLRGAAVLVAVALVPSLLAVSKASAQNNIALPTIDVVSATLIPTPSQQTASSVTVITAADIEREQRRTVPDALMLVPGLNVVQAGGPGAQTSVFMRGTNANHVKVFLDGIDIGDPSTPAGAFDFAHLSTGDIERIEVLRGPQSGLYGSDAIGGVISITTKKGQGPMKVSGTLEGGSLGTFNQNAGISGSEGIFNYAFNVQHLRSTQIPVTPLNLLAPGERRINDSYDNRTYSTRLGAQVSAELALNFIGRYTDARLGFTGEDYVNFAVPSPEALQSKQVNHNAFTRGEGVWSPLSWLKNVFGVSYTNQYTWGFNPNADGFAPFPPVSPPVTTIGERTKFDWRSEATVAPGQVIVLGLEHQKDELRTDQTSDFTPGFVQTTTTAKTGNKAAFAELQSDFQKRLFLVANIRVDDNESFGEHTTWRVAPAFLVPVTETKLKASYGTGFKAPSLTQLFVTNPGFLTFGNPGLRPELSKGYDYGFEQPLLNDRVRFGATYFHNSIQNLIVSKFDPALGAFGGFTNVNVGSATTYGVEAFGSAVITDRVKVRADYTYTHTRDESTGLGLLRRPANKASLTAIWNPVDRASVTATLLYVGRWVDIDRSGFTPRLDAAGYTTINLAANYEVNDRLTVFGRVDNLLDKHYEDPTGFLRPGIALYGGARVTN